MPEGHKVFRLALDHRPLVGKRIRVSSPQGRFEDGARLIDGRILRRVESYGKHLVYTWSGNLFLHIHLGLYGKYRWLNTPFAEPRGQVRLRMTTKDFGFDLNGPNCCEVFEEKDLRELVRRLGPDPLRENADPRRFQSAVRKSARPIGILVLDQKVIAGVGNIYRSEVLFLLGIHPNRPGHCLTIRELGKLWNQFKRLMKVGVKYNSIITAEPKDVGKPRKKMERNERLLIYKKIQCPRCSADVEKFQLASRSIYICPECQV